MYTLVKAIESISIPFYSIRNQSKDGIITDIASIWGHRCQKIICDTVYLTLDLLRRSEF